MHESRGDVGEWHEHEAPLGDQGVGDLQLLGPDDLVPVEEDVEVDGPRSVTPGRLPSQALLDPLDERQELEGTEEGRPPQGHVQEAGLVGDVRRLRLVDGRDRLDVDLGAELLERLGEVGLPVAEVRAEPEVDRARSARRHRHAPPSNSR